MSVYWVDPWKTSGGDGTFNNPYSPYSDNPLYNTTIYDCDEFRIKSKLICDIVCDSFTATPILSNGFTLKNWQLSKDIEPFKVGNSYCCMVVIGEDGLVSMFGSGSMGQFEPSTCIFKLLDGGGQQTMFPFQHKDWSRPVNIKVMNPIYYNSHSETTGCANILGRKDSAINICNYGCKFIVTDGWINETTRCINKEAVSIFSGYIYNLTFHNTNQNYCNGSLTINACVDLSNSSFITSSDISFYFNIPNDTKTLNSPEQIDQIITSLNNSVPENDSFVLKIKNTSNVSTYKKADILFSRFYSFANQNHKESLKNHSLNPSKKTSNHIYIEYFNNGWYSLINDSTTLSNSFHSIDNVFHIENLIVSNTYGNTLYKIFPNGNPNDVSSLCVNNIILGAHTSSYTPMGVGQPGSGVWDNVYINNLLFYADTNMTDNVCTNLPLNTISNYYYGDNSAAENTNLYFPESINNIKTLYYNEPLHIKVPDLYTYKKNNKRLHTNENFTNKLKSIYNQEIYHQKIMRAAPELKDTFFTTFQVVNSDDMYNKNKVNIINFNVSSTFNIVDAIDNINNQTFKNYNQNRHGQLNIIINKNYEYANTIIVLGAPDSQSLVIGSKNYEFVKNDLYSIRYSNYNMTFGDMTNKYVYMSESYSISNSFSISYVVPINIGVKTIVKGSVRNKCINGIIISKIELVSNSNSVYVDDLLNIDDWEDFTLTLPTQIHDDLAYLNIICKAYDNSYLGEMDIFVTDLGVTYEL